MLFKDWWKEGDDLYNKLNALITQRLFTKGEDGKLHMETREALDSPWMSIKKARGRYCSLWHTVWLGIFRIVPMPCHNCYKVVIAPRTLFQLFQLATLLRNLNIPSKCGIETRWYVRRPYGGYVYADSLEEGMEYWHLVRTAVDLHIDPEIKVFLKRGCTEMEQLRPDSSSWEQQKTAEEVELERKLDEVFAQEPKYPAEVDWLTNQLKRRWVRYAIKLNDPTVPIVLGKDAQIPEIAPPVIYSPESKWDKEKKCRVFARISKVKKEKKDADRTTKTKICKRKHDTRPCNRKKDKKSK